MSADLDDQAFVRELARRIRLRRRYHNLTQQHVADRAGLSRSFVSVFETGRHGIEVTALRRLARALDVPLSALIAEPGDDTSLGDLIRRTRAE